MNVPAPHRTDEFSSEAGEALTRALQRYLSTDRAERHEELRAVMEWICAEALAKELGPERVLIAVKSTWMTLPELVGIDPDRQRIALDRVVGYRLDAYYGQQT